MKSIISEQEHESYVLKWAGEDDAKVYLTKLAVERRESLAFRNKEGRRHRLLEEEWRREEIQKAHAEEELQAGSKLTLEYNIFSNIFYRFYFLTCFSFFLKDFNENLCIF